MQRLLDKGVSSVKRSRCNAQRPDEILILRRSGERDERLINIETTLRERPRGPENARRTHGSFRCAQQAEIMIWKPNSASSSQAGWRGFG
jgi:hypothetical protein